MQIVVKIPDDMIKSLEQGSFGAKYNTYDIVGCLMNGTPLSKGHERLIDADETINKICGESCGCHLEECGYDVPCYSVARINSASTIIGADTESEA